MYKKTFKGLFDTNGFLIEMNSEILDKFFLSKNKLQTVTTGNTWGEKTIKLFCLFMFIIRALATKAIADNILFTHTQLNMFYFTFLYVKEIIL